MSSKNWEEMILSDICNNIQYGYTQSAIHKKIGPKFLRITDVRNNFISWDNVPFCRINKQNYKRYKLEEGDIVIARTGATTGINKYIDKNVPDAVFASYLVRLKINKLNDPKFIYYILSSKNYKEYIKSYIGGSAQPNANAKTLTSFKVKIPNLLEQKSISAILSSLDLKIELNSQINKNLEQIAQVIFKHWFVDFEFPNENGEPYKSSGGEMVESEIGQVPKEWKIEKLKKIIRFVKGKKPKIILKEKSDKLSKYLTINVLSGKEYLYAQPKGVILTEKENILIVMDGASSGKIYFGVNGIVASTIAKVKILNNNFSTEYIYHFLKYHENEINNHTSGSAIPHTDKNFVLSLRIALPDANNIIFSKFNKTIGSVENKIIQNNDENKRLAKIRDALLPKLMSGEIRIPINNKDEVNGYARKK